MRSHIKITITNESFIPTKKKLFVDRSSFSTPPSPHIFQTYKNIFEKKTQRRHLKLNK